MQTETITKDLLKELEEITEKYNKLLPSYEIAHILIIHGCDIMLSCAPSQLIAMKTIMVSIQDGIEFHEAIDKESCKDIYHNH